MMMMGYDDDDIGHQYPVMTQEGYDVDVYEISMMILMMM